MASDMQTIEVRYSSGLYAHTTLRVAYRSHRSMAGRSLEVRIPTGVGEGWIHVVDTGSRLAVVDPDLEPILWDEVDPFGRESTQHEIGLAAARAVWGLR